MICDVDECRDETPGQKTVAAVIIAIAEIGFWYDIRSTATLTLS